MGFISERFMKSSFPDEGLPIMFTIRGETDIPERELSHLDGYRGSKPVRIGNGAAFHKQFDIYGELMDGIYLYNKYGKPINWEQWCSVRHMLDYVLTIMDQPDMSIWEVRNNKQHFTYSKIMLWVAFGRGLRLSEKRNFPCQNRAKWLAARDSLYEEIMEKGFNKEMNCFIQSYENNTMLDSSILIAPLVFFIAPNDPRFLSTMDRILLPPEKGGLTSTGLVYRYNTEVSEDGEFWPPFICNPLLADCLHRRWRPRGSFQHVRFLAGGSHDPGERVRAEVSAKGHQSLPEYPELLQPPDDVLGGDRAQWRAARKHSTGLQSFGPHQCRLQLGSCVRVSEVGRCRVAKGREISNTFVKFYVLVLPLSRCPKLES